MVKCYFGAVEMQGDMAMVLSEVTCILKCIYERLVDEMGKESALEELAHLGRLAVMTDEQIRKDVAGRITAEERREALECLKEMINEELE